MPGLRTIKLAHTLAWVVFAGSIVALPIAAAMRRFGLALFFACLVLVEVVILVFNGFRCPLTAVAARYTTDRSDNFDIYLPLWLARYNKQIFGTLYVLGLVFAVIQYSRNE